MKRLSLLCLAFLILAAGLAPAQEPATDAGKEEQLKAAYMKIMRAGPMPTVDRSRAKDPAYRKEFMAKRQAAMDARKEAAKIFLEEHAADLKSGIGHLYRANALMIMGERKQAAPAFEAFRAEVPDHAEREVASVMLLQCYRYGTNDVAAAKKLAAELKDAELPEQLNRVLARMLADFPSWEKRESLTGKVLPDVPVVDTIGAPENFSFAALKGKVVVIDFWATWCPPCRAIIPGLVRLQEKYKDAGLQVIGLTTFYGSGWQFTGREGDTLKGVPVGGRGADALEKDAEKEVNEAFYKGVPLNYPIVFTEKTVGRGTFGVTGIPTVFVLDRKGVVRWHKVGGGDEKPLHEWVEKLLAEK